METQKKITKQTENQSFEQASCLRMCQIRWRSYLSPFRTDEETWRLEGRYQTGYMQ